MHERIRPAAIGLIILVTFLHVAPNFATDKPGTSYQRPPLDPRLTEVTDPNLVWRFYPGSGDQTLPRVLMIGDSITYGYAHDVANRLSTEGKAVADIWLTPNNLRGWMLHEDLASILAQGPYDVVHFNIGLHEWDQQPMTDYNFEPLMTAYLKTMLKNAKWLDRMKTKKAKLIWASITPVSEDVDFTTLKAGQNDEVISWNETAATLMKKAGITINDLYSLMVTNLTLKRDSLHFSGEGSTMIADAVTSAITSQLPEKSSTKTKK